MRNIRLVFSYDGTRYHGFQAQLKTMVRDDGSEFRETFRVTVQDELQNAIRELTGEENIQVIASGRTDAGVHAFGQVANFVTQSRIPIERWCLALNARLPDTIVVRIAEEVDASFHSRRSAKRKTYRYTINNDKWPDVFRKHIQYHHPRPLDQQAMQSALTAIEGEHDFTSFCSRKSTKRSHVRTIYKAWLETESPNIIHIYVTGNGFLYNMVRIIVGALIQIGEGKRPAEQMKTILEAKDRSAAGPTAMAHGLMLWEVDYND